MAEANENNTGNVTGGAEKPKTNVRYIHGVPIYTEPETSDSASAKDGIAKDGGSSNNPFAEIPHGGVSRKMKKRSSLIRRPRMKKRSSPVRNRKRRRLP